jgi:hypothetical protein
MHAQGKTPSRRPGTIEIVTIDAAVTIVIETIVAIRTFIRQATTRRRALAIGVETIDNGIAIIVDAIVTHLAGGRRSTPAIRSLCTREVVTIRNTIAIVVRTVGAILFIARKNLRIKIVAITTAA